MDAHEGPLDAGLVVRREEPGDEVHESSRLLEVSRMTRALEELPGRIGEASTIGLTTLGVASSCSPEMTSAGSSISRRRGVMSQAFSDPMTWNSLGPFIVCVHGGVRLQLGERLKRVVGRTRAAVEQDERRCLPGGEVSGWRPLALERSKGESSVPRR